MTELNRREFIQTSTASLLLNRVPVSASPGNQATLNDTAKTMQVRMKKYTWD